jgi:glutathione synthase
MAKIAIAVAMARARGSAQYTSPVRLAFIVADVKGQRPTYATVYLAQAAMRVGHEVAFVGVDDLTMTADNQVTALVTKVTPRATNEELCAALAAGGSTGEDALSGYDVVFLRYNPHREAIGAAPGNPAADFGWRLGLSGVLVVNDPEGTQRAGGRMYLSGLPSEIRPRTLITREPAKVKAFLKALDAPAVLKPLAEKEGEEHIFYVARGQVKNLNQIITVVRKTGYVVVQEYLPDATQGEKRLLLLGGDPIRIGKRVAIYRRMVADAGLPGVPKPKAKANASANGEGPGGRRRCDFGDAEQKIVDLLRPKLVSDGLYFVSVDIVGDKVLEVNVFTPGGIHSNRELYGIDVAEVVIRDLERRVEVRRAYRKTLDRVA